jgi:hypothetical protein
VWLIDEKEKRAGLELVFWWIEERGVREKNTYNEIP